MNNWLCASSRSTLATTQTDVYPAGESDSCDPEENRLNSPVVSPVFEKVKVRGKFLFAGDHKFWVKGVSYGAFRPDASGNEYTDERKIAHDFALMAAAGINTVRIPHTVPPRALLDIAQQHGLRVMVGLSAEQYAGYLIDRKNTPDLEARVRSNVRRLAGHPALLCYAIGNEIQASMVRWIGRRRVEQYIERHYRIIKSEDPESLVTYVNYPSTEYLQLPFLDMLTLNVYLEKQDRLASYLARLQNVAGERPLIMSELGLDSIRNGEEAQAESLTWQLRTAFSGGCAGAVVFSWTDEWYRAEAEVADWAFGLVGRDRQPKPALAAVKAAYADVPFPADTRWPSITVVVCSYNGGPTIRDTLEGLEKLEYPNYEVIVINDGSTDNTCSIASDYPFRLINTENRGLSNARNRGWEEANGEIVAYIDDDAFPDPHWLYYLASTFMQSQHVGVGGPNLAPPGDGFYAHAVARAPGGPMHVLLSDDVAEHIPGCNMAFRRAALAEIGGFDGRYRTAGDDVDVCWRLQERGGTLGFNAAAMVWHHRRNSVSAYWRQQIGYGKAEALLEDKWPEKYNTLGHTTWGGRLYGPGLTLPLLLQQRVYSGVMGNAPFQSLFEPAPGTLASLPLMPEWYLVIVLLGILSLLGVTWSPALLVLPLFLLAAALPIAQAAVSAGRSRISYQEASGFGRRACLRCLIALLHLIQPLARLKGRLRHGLTLWRKQGSHAFVMPVRRSFAIWTEQWAEPETRAQFIADTLREERIRFQTGGPFDRWDLGVPGGLLGSARLLVAVEDHGGGTQYVRLRVWPRCSWGAVISVGLLTPSALAAATDNAWLGAGILACGALAVAIRTIWESGASMGALVAAVNRLEQKLTNRKAG